VHGGNIRDVPKKISESANCGLQKEDVITAVDGVRAWRGTHTFYLAHECHNTISDTREDAMPWKY